MLKSAFAWLDAHPVAYWVLAGLASVGLALRVVAVLRTESRPARPWADPLILLLFLLAWRWPFLLFAGELNPDESQLIAGAITLSHDPVFWRSVDGMTSGPLNFYVLVPLRWIGAPLDFFTVRLVALLMVWGSLWASLSLLRRHAGAGVAWLALLPAASFYATVFHPDLIHYSSEHFPVLLLAVAALLLAGVERPQGWRLIIGAALAGAAPWAKLQVGPMSAVLVLWAAWRLWSESVAGPRPWRAYGRLFGAALAPTLFIGTALAATGVAGIAWERYFENNLLYVGQAQPLLVALEAMRALAAKDGRVPLFIGTVVVLAVGLSVALAIRRTRPPAFAGWAALFALTAVVALAAPRREYLHYTLLLPVPFTLLLGALLGPWWRSVGAGVTRFAVAATVVAIGLVLPLATRARQNVPFMFGQFAYDWRYPRTPEAEVVRGITAPGGSFAAWGWACNLHVESGVPQATRDPHSIWLIYPHPRIEAYRRQYVEDLARSAPTVFVDATGPGAFALANRAETGHEIVPELAKYIRRYYTLVADLGRSRIYLRNQPDGQPLADPRVPAWLARGRPLPAALTAAAESVPLSQPGELDRRHINGHEVIMVHPPCRVEWPLPPDARTVQLEFGFDPTAVIEGTSNGAEIFVELRDAEVRRLLHRQFLDPRQRPADRQPVRLTLPLPPFNASSRLVIRTDPGPYGDTAWDWVYLGALTFHQGPSFAPESFPGFNRVPDAAQAPLSRLVPDGGEQVFESDPPVNLTFKLRGGERQLRLEFGLRPSAYTGDGRSDGATFRVELQRPGLPVRPLWHRFLQPVTHPADRGPQAAVVPLDSLQAGDFLILRIDSGPAFNGAWDSTYLRRVTFN